MHEQDPHGRLREFVGQLIQQKGADSSLLDNLPQRGEKKKAGNISLDQNYGLQLHLL